MSKKLFDDYDNLQDLEKQFVHGVHNEKTNEHNNVNGLKLNKENDLKLNKENGLKLKKENGLKLKNENEINLSGLKAPTFDKPSQEDLNFEKGLLFDQYKSMYAQVEHNNRLYQDQLIFCRRKQETLANNYRGFMWAGVILAITGFILANTLFRILTPFIFEAAIISIVIAYDNRKKYYIMDGTNVAYIMIHKIITYKDEMNHCEGMIRINDNLLKKKRTLENVTQQDLDELRTYSDYKDLRADPGKIQSKYPLVVQFGILVLIFGLLIALMNITDFLYIL